MYECPNCGGNLKFDIASQLIKCEYCLTAHDPYQITRDRDAEENNDFDVTIFTCPQCGGEILSTDISAAEFCSFCGASTILDSRVSREKKPARIIPFKQTREACKKAYIARMKRAIFAPDELKDEKYIDGFRGIYMPYWAYNISQQGTVRLKGEKRYRKGDYIYTDHYALSGELDACYNNLSYDASASFADNISERIAPFDVKDSQKFTPSFLSGFYADTADVDSKLYEQDAIKLANTASYNKVKSTPAFSGLKLSVENNGFAMTTALHTFCDAPERVMYPVWFMSYRKGDRVAYATVNGQSGKVAADIPVDARKYVLGSLLLAFPIFLLLNLFFTIKAENALEYSAFLALVTLAIHIIEIINIYKRDKRKDDRGYLSHQTKQTSALNGKKKASDGISFHEFLAYSTLEGKYKAPGFIGSLAAIAVNGFIRLVHPISDLWYYGGTIISFLGILFTITAIIQKYNILATRKLPQFDRRGGDDHA